MENYYWNEEELRSSKKVYILLIYDITSNRRRISFVKYLLGIGARVQKSAFEAMIPQNIYRRLLKDIPRYIDAEEDSVRVYKIYGSGEVTLYGKNIEIEDEELIIL